MGNICGGAGKADVAADYRPSSPGTSNYKTSGSVTTSNSTTGKLSSGGSSTFMASAGSGGTSGGFDEAAAGFLEGQILEAPNLRTFTFLELKTATKNFRPDSVLGEGGFGRVYKGWVDEKTMNPTKSGTGMVVAVKKLNSESMQGYEEWQSEINFLGRLSHPNLVKLLGYCWEDKELLLVYEFMAKGSLENHLFRSHLYVKSDVYGFGVVMLEMLSGKRALDPNRPNGQQSLVDWAKPYLADRRKLARLMDPQFEGQYNSKQSHQAAQLTLNCLAGEPRSRPSMKEVLETLEQIEALKSRTREARGGSGTSSRDRAHGRSAAVHQRSSPRGNGDGRRGSRPTNGHATKAR
ncbi:unnamed protein product [Triticum turgidum subsp. durum]|uniref:non-specific serine/threonine protein kinase n=1 Tax=Triticum turgidum subsp. durum TaxID=4567 RepID=A0A9R0XTB6_TRITD|nr:unnamed protein product [Triticum turgidum subsp. durum]